MTANRLTAFVSLLALSASAALAADTRSPANAANSAGSSRSSNSVFELHAAPRPAAPTASSPARRPALTAEQKALDDILQRAQTEVTALAQSVQAMPYGPARDGIERKIVETKLRYRVEFLRALAAQQRGRGELAAAQSTDAIVDQLLNPKPVPAHTEAQSPNRPGTVK